MSELHSSFDDHERVQIPTFFRLSDIFFWVSSGEVSIFFFLFIFFFVVFPLGHKQDGLQVMVRSSITPRCAPPRPSQPDGRCLWRRVAGWPRPDARPVYAAANADPSTTGWPWVDESWENHTELKCQLNTVIPPPRPSSKATLFAKKLWPH